MLGIPPLTFVIGKGGVGKSTVAAALALASATDDARVALVEFATDQFATLFETEAIDYEGTSVAPGVEAFSLHPRDAFAEYATRRLHSKTLYRTMFDNRFVHYFLDATPGVNEIMCLGKLWEMVTEGDWDRIIVDLPTTGHGLGFLKVPRVVTATVHHGPIFELGDRIGLLLENPAQTAVVITSLCEELPVNEALEIAAALDGKLQMRCCGVVANRMMQRPVPATLARDWATLQKESDTAQWQPHVAATQYLEKRWDLQQTQYERLLNEFGTRLYTLPEIDAPAGLPRFQAVAHAISRWPTHPATRRGVKSKN